MRIAFALAAALACGALWSDPAFKAVPLERKKADPSLLFLSTFDTLELKADVAKGEAAPQTMRNVQLALRGFVGFDGQQAYRPEVGEALRYPAKGNFNPHRGTLVFWACGLDYDPESPKLDDGKERGNVSLVRLVAADGPKWIEYHFYAYGNVFIGHWRSSEPPAWVGQQGMLQCRQLGIRRGQWYQVAVTWDDSTLTLYLNGARRASSPVPAKASLTADLMPDASTNSFVAVKASHWDDDNSLGTAVDDVAIYDRVLSPIEINNAYYAVARNTRYLKKQAFSVSLEGRAAGRKGPVDRAVATLDLAGIDFSAGPVEALWTLKAPDGSVRKGRWKIGGKVASEVVTGVDRPGDYELSVSIGKESAQAKITRPDYSWVGNGIGDEDEVPALWRDFAADGRTVTLWNRRYRFGAGPFPESVRVGGRELLAEPPRLRIGGREPAWTAGATERKVRSVVYRGTGRLGAATFSYRTEVEYDGLVRVGWTIDGEPEIASMNLEWRVRPEFAEFAMVPWSPDDPDHVAFPFPRSTSHPKTLWLVGERKGGFAWTAVSDANWIHGKDANVAFADRTTGACRVEMIQRRVRLPAAVSYEALFITTPTRPFADIVHGLRFDGRDKRGMRLDCDATRAVDSAFTHMPIDANDWFRRVNEKFGKGTRAMYGGAQSFSDDMPMAVYLRKFWEIPGMSNYSMSHARETAPGKAETYRTISIPVCPSTFANDYVVLGDERLWNHPMGDRFAVTYYDLCNCSPCANRIHGCGHTDLFGREVTTFTTLGLREFVKRVVAVAHRHGRLVMLHGQRDYMPFADGLADYWYPGEQHCAEMNQSPYAYTDIIPDRIWRTEFNRDVLGVGIVQAGTIGQLAGSRKYRYEAKYTEALLAAVLPYDIESSVSYTDMVSVPKVWDIYERLGMNSRKTVCHRFYEQKEIGVSNPDVRVTWYELPDGGRLLVVATKTAQVQPVTLDVSATGDWAKAVDEYRQRAFPVTDGKVEFDVPARSFRLITLKKDVL